MVKTVRVFGAGLSLGRELYNWSPGEGGEVSRLEMSEYAYRRAKWRQKYRKLRQKREAERAARKTERMAQPVSLGVVIARAKLEVKD